jgi:predicted metal-dependent enzyme (double-stranded beta helix superfamily)
MDAFVAACVDALAEADPLAAIREQMEQAVARPADIARLREPPIAPDDDGVVHASPDLLVTFAMFPRGFATGIHDHGVGAVIGTWAAHEDNLLYRRTPAGLEALPPRRVAEGEVLVLDADAIHDVHAPSSRWSGALHVYLGDIVHAERTFWADAGSPGSRFDGSEQDRSWRQAARATGLLA